MARTPVPPGTLVRHASVVQATGVAADPTNGHSIAAPSVSGQAILLDIDSTFAGVKSWAIKAGPIPGSQDLVLSLNAQRALVLIDERSLIQADGSVNVDPQSGATGTVRAYYLPHH